MNSAPPRFLLKLILSGMMVAGIVAGVIAQRHRSPARKSPAFALASPTSSPATSATTTPASAPSVQVAPPATVLDVLRLDDAVYPTTQPLDIPADLADAAKLVLHRPAYVDPQGNLWLTHPDGRPIGEALRGPIGDHTAVVRDTVLCVNWPPSGRAPSAVAKAADGTLQCVTGTAPTSSDAPSVLPPLVDPDFAAALPVGDGAIVPTRGGATVLFISPTIDAKLVAGGPEMNRPVLAPTNDGALLWSPWENGRPGSVGAIRIDPTGVHALTVDDGWPARPVQLVPLGDGGVLAIAIGDHGPELKMIPPPSGPPAADLLRLVDPLARQLGNEDPVVRENAQRQLESLGPSAWPVLEAMRETLPPEAQVRIESILGERLSPTLGGLHPLDGTVTPLARFPGGGCILRLEGGGTVDNDDGTSRSVVPAIVSIRPGRSIEMIDPAAVSDFHPHRQSIQSVSGELLIVDPNAGPQRWVGHQFFPLVPPGLKRFDTLLGVDARRRWLFSNSQRPGEWLLLDPSLPDLTPKLPVWIVDAGDAAGWTDAGWPAVKRGEQLFVLEAHGWNVGPIRGFHTTVATTLPATEPSVTGRPIAAAGHAFVYSDDGMIRRYAGVNAAGRAGRIQAIFPTGVPGATRAWIDPAGRLVLVAPQRLAIAFPDGRIPADLAALMLHLEN